MTTERATPTDVGHFTEVTFTTTDRRYPLVWLSTDPQCHVEVLETIPATTVGPCFTGFLRVCERPPERIRRVVRDCPLAETVTVLGEFDDECLVELAASECILQTIEETTPTILSRATATAGEARLAVVLPPSVDAEDVVEPVVDAHEGLEVSAIRTPRVPTPLLTARSLQSLLEERLTDRQWEALRLAHGESYFDRPRGTTQRELADAMGISQETFSQHLRAAEDKLLSLVLRR